ncbi:hypothetical protein [Pelagicoccus mobilis]|uniref:GNAT family N-acetyltransferase n=1 Tax=Pelagicoccus mobilis TaxID=415221 RepID=A0A934VMF1_9BACT|nr:hypothetical protein [Pelagicoccus mobilis]MBK1878781.1 hypothetical protein [Pelagicoccus mobilis]
MPAFRYLIEPLDPKIHDRESFICEEPALNDFIRKQANRESKANTSRCFVLTTKESPTTIRGYYTLSATSISLSNLPEKTAKKLPNRDKVPATLLGRIARDLSFKSEGIGEHLMFSALNRAYLASLEVASSGVVIDPKNEPLANYYANYGFIKLQGDESSIRMFLLMKDIESNTR